MTKDQCFCRAWFERYEVLICMDFREAEASIPVRKLRPTGSSVRGSEGVDPTYIQRVGRTRVNGYREVVPRLLSGEVRPVLYVDWPWNRRPRRSAIIGTVHPRDAKRGTTLRDSIDNIWVNRRGGELYSLDTGCGEAVGACIELRPIAVIARGRRVNHTGREEACRCVNCSIAHNLKVRRASTLDKSPGSTVILRAEDS